MSKTDGVKFEIHLKGDVTGKLWSGSFRSKTLLSFRDKLRADSYRRELLGGTVGSVDPESAAAALVISQLSVRLTETPEWWSASKGGLDLEDANVLEKVYEAAMQVEKDHLASIEKEGQAAQDVLRAEKK